MRKSGGYGSGLRDGGETVRFDGLDQDISQLAPKALFGDLNRQVVVTVAAASVRELAFKQNRKDLTDTAFQVQAAGFL